MYLHILEVIKSSLYVTLHDEGRYHKMGLGVGGGGEGEGSEEPCAKQTVAQGNKLSDVFECACFQCLIILIFISTCIFIYVKL